MAMTFQQRLDMIAEALLQEEREVRGQSVRREIRGIPLAQVPTDVRRTLPESLLSDLHTARAKWGATMHDDECAELMNEVAWKNRGTGWGLSGKNFGTHGTLHDGKTHVAHDILHHRESDTIYDCLIAAGRESTPTWGYLGKNTNANRPWTAPIAPRGVDPGKPIDPQKPPTPPPSIKIPDYEAIGGDGFHWRTTGGPFVADYLRRQEINGGISVWFGRVMHRALRYVVNDKMEYTAAVERATEEVRSELRQALGTPEGGW